MKSLKTVNQMAFGNHQLKNFGLGSLSAGAIATICGLVAIRASEVNFYAEGEQVQSQMQELNDAFMDAVEK